MPRGRMLHMCFPQAWFNLSDPAVEEALYDSAGCAPLPRWIRAAKLPRMRPRCASFGTRSSRSCSARPSAGEREPASNGTRNQDHERHALPLRCIQHPGRAKCSARPAARHTSAECIAFLTDSVAHQPRGKEIGVIADYLGAQDRSDRRVPGSSSQCVSALHCDLLVRAQPGRAVVRQDRA